MRCERPKDAFDVTFSRPLFERWGIYSRLPPQASADLAFLADFPRLGSLALNDNPVSAQDDYRVAVLRLAPGLRELDQVVRGGALAWSADLAAQLESNTRCKRPTNARERPTPAFGVHPLANTTSVLLYIFGTLCLLEYMYVF